VGDGTDGEHDECQRGLRGVEPVCTGEDQSHPAVEAFVPGISTEVLTAPDVEDPTLCQRRVRVTHPFHPLFGRESGVRQAVLELAPRPGAGWSVQDRLAMNLFAGIVGLTAIPGKQSGLGRPDRRRMRRSHRDQAAARRSRARRGDVERGTQGSADAGAGRRLDLLSSRREAAGASTMPANPGHLTGATPWC
jgi:hypothetical protein